MSLTIIEKRNETGIHEINMHEIEKGNYAEISIPQFFKNWSHFFWWIHCHGFDNSGSDGFQRQSDKG